MEQVKTIFVSPEAMAHTVRKVVEITETPIDVVGGRKIIRRVEKILMPNGRYRYPVTYIDTTPGYVDLSEIWAEEKRAPGYKMDFTL